MLVLCLGMPRSGSTLQFNLVQALVKRCVVEVESCYMAAEEIDDPQALECMLDANRWNVVKSHDAPAFLGSSPFLNHADLRIVYCHRNLLDVAGSLRLKWSYGDDRIRDVLRHAVSVGEFVEALPSGLSQPYALLQSDPARAVRGLAEHLGLTVDAGVIDEVVAECSLDHAESVIRRQARSPRAVVARLAKLLGRQRDAYDRKTLLHYDHISQYRGQGGYFGDVLAEELIAAIRNDHAQWMAAHQEPDTPSVAPGHA